MFRSACWIFISWGTETNSGCLDRKEPRARPFSSRSGGKSVNRMLDVAPEGKLDISGVLHTGVVFLGTNSRMDCSSHFPS